MKSWLTQHSQALQLVLRRFKANKLSTLFICLTIGVTLALPSIMYTVLDSLSGLANNVKSESQLSVFLATEHNQDAVATIKTALMKLQSAESSNSVLNALESNPLPDAFFVEPNKLDATSVANLKNEIAKLDGVDEVVMDGAWIKRLNYLILYRQKAMVILAGLLSLALIAVIGNTIRMQVLTQQAEIEVSQLIGATKSFIRRPFLYAGAIYGLIGGLLALLITCVVIFLFNQSLSALVAEYQTNFSLNLPGFSSLSVLSLLSSLVGLISAYFSASKSLYKSIG